MPLAEGRTLLPLVCADQHSAELLPHGALAADKLTKVKIYVDDRSNTKVTASSPPNTLLHLACVKHTPADELTKKDLDMTKVILHQTSHS
jgi:hypothetical protein